MCNSSSHAVSYRDSSLILNIFSFAPCIQLWNFPSKNSAQIAKVNLKPCTGADGRKKEEKLWNQISCQNQKRSEKIQNIAQQKVFHVYLARSLFERKKRD